MKCRDPIGSPAGDGDIRSFAASFEHHTSQPRPDVGERARREPHLVGDQFGGDTGRPFRVGTVHHHPVGRCARNCGGQSSACTSSALPSSPVIRYWFPGPDTARLRAIRAGSGSGRSTDAMAGLRPGSDLNCQVRPLAAKCSASPAESPVPPGRQRPAVPSPASTGAHRPQPVWSMMPATATEPATEMGLMEAAPSRGGEFPVPQLRRKGADARGHGHGRLCHDYS